MLILSNQIFGAFESLFRGFDFDRSLVADENQIDDVLLANWTTMTCNKMPLLATDCIKILLAYLYKPPDSADCRYTQLSVHC